MTTSQLVADTEVQPGSSVFFVGCFETRVTVLSQQIRALNLVDAILAERRVREHGRVAVIGGGISGVTAAAAMAVAAPTLRAIDIYERQPDLLHLQRGSGRHLHPHIYDWPARGSEDPDSRLPILSWPAAPAGQVVDTILRQFEALRKLGNIHLKTSRKVSGVSPFEQAGCQVFVEGAPSDGGTYDCAIISIGFGYERLMQGENKSYWTPSPLAASIVSNEKHVVFVSGNGDGGLVDFIMAAFNGLPHQAVVEFLISYPGLDEVKRTLLEIDRRAWELKDGELDIYQNYLDVVRPKLPPHLLLDVHDRLRNIELWFHTNEPRLFRRDTAILNRFAAFLILAADKNSSRKKIRLCTNAVLNPQPPLTGPITISGGGHCENVTIDPLYRFLRFGADKKANLLPFHALVRTYEKNRPRNEAVTFRPATPAVSQSARLRFTMAASVGSAALRPAPSPAPSGQQTSALTVSVFARQVRQSIIVVLPFDEETIFAVPVTFLVGNRGDKTIDEINLTAELPDSIYLRELERSTDRIAEARSITVTTDRGWNEQVAKVLYRIPQAPPHTVFSMADWVFARKPSVIDTIVDVETGALGVKLFVSMSINVTVDARDISPLRHMAKLEFRGGDINDFSSVVKAEEMLSRELLKQDSRVEPREVTFIGFRRFTDNPVAGLKLRNADARSAIAHNATITGSGITGLAPISLESSVLV